MTKKKAVQKIVAKPEPKKAYCPTWLSHLKHIAFYSGFVSGFALGSGMGGAIVKLFFNK